MKKLLLLFSLLLGWGTTMKAEPIKLVVAQDGSGTHTTVQGAVDACTADGQRNIIFIKNGIYKERVNAPSDKLISLIGESRDGVLITFDRNRGASGGFTDYRDVVTCQFYGQDMYVENLSIENSSGNVGQAEAIFTAGDCQTYKNCRFLGYQDTHRTKGGVRGYFKDCRIEGATDYIYGDGLMYFDDCTLNCVNGGGYVAAPGEKAFTLKKTDTATGRILHFNYIFRNCEVSANGDVADNTYYLGRPWGQYGGAYYLNCKIGNHVKAEGWNPMGGDTYKTATMGEFGSRDWTGNSLDVSKRIDWSFQLAQADAEKYTPEYIFAQINKNKTFEPKSLCESVSTPTYVENTGKTINWGTASGAIGYIVLKNGKYLASVDGTSFTDQEESVGHYSVKAIAAHGALSAAVKAVNTETSLLKAFPTAEGFGKLATGGRGGKVVTVTTLKDDTLGTTQGSLRWALNQYPSNFTVVFAVSGLIELVCPLQVKKTNYTIAGQTAPGDGICITKHKFNCGGSSNFIIRHIRFRVGQVDIKGNIIAENSFGAENCENFIIDHCSFGWSVEENMNTFDDHFHTVQWCIVHEGLYDAGHSKGARGYACQWGGSSATYHHNLLANNSSRSCRFNGSRGKTVGQDLSVFIEYINNVNYNWGRSNSCYGGENTSENAKFYGHEANFINNYYKPGPATPKTNLRFFNQSLAREGVTSKGPSKWYFGGNIMEGDAAVTADNWKGFDNGTSYSIDDIKQNEIIQPTGDRDHTKYKYDWSKYTYADYETAQDAYNSVLASSGAFPRDPIDSRVIENVRTGTAYYGDNGILNLPSDAEGYPAYDTFDTVIDNDGDGMDDAWEAANGLNPSDPEDRNLTNSLGYTALEIYLNSLVNENIKHEFATSISAQQVAELFLENTVADDELKFSGELMGAYIYTINGMKIKGVSLMGKNVIDVSELHAGYYIISAYTVDGQLKLAKFLKK